MHSLTTYERRWRARTIKDFGERVEELRRRREPPVALELPEGLDLDLLADDVLSVYELATTQPLLSLKDTQDISAPITAEGSNNWVIAGHRTATGRPILANDPHRVANTLPSLRYIAHISAPGIDAVGGGEPALPGISIGHNGQVAFGMTLSAIDQEDLYLYELMLIRLRQVALADVAPRFPAHDRGVPAALPR